MLGVLKRRWKPKRASNGSRFSSDINQLDSDKHRLAPSVRQVHPLCDEKAQLLAYEKPSSLETNHNNRPSIDLNASPPPYPKRASLDSNPSPTSYPITPNICVEAGRIEFIKQTVDGALESVATTKIDERITITRGLQTDEDEKLDDTKRESAQRDADRERRLRADSEARAKQALQEAARCRSRLKLLTHEFSRMEETVRSMLVYKSRAEQLRQEKAALTVAFESRCQQYQTTITRLNQEITTLRQQVDKVHSEPGSREGALQAHSVALHRQAEESRKQYERCLDDVANQVVKALLAQKGLREEITNLHKRIQDLESQNRALTSMLVHQLRGDSMSASDLDLSASNHLALEDSSKIEDNTSADVSPTNLMKTSLTVKHCNSFNSDVLDNSSSESHTETITNFKILTKTEKHLSADSNLIDKQFSLEDKKRHQILTQLWTELKGTEVTPKRLLEALSSVDSSLWIPPQRPVSLNLQLPILQAAKYRRSRPIIAQSSKSEEETTGNESPESGNRDEGYSTMSSDVQAEVSKASGEVVSASRGLEDLKEATDETEVAETRLLTTDNQDSDILYIPINLLGINPRNSYPPSKEILPFQHIMRSFSDSHLCIKITTAPSPCYSLSSPISSSPSILLLDITEKKMNPLRRVKAAASLLVICLASGAMDFLDDQTSPSSWSSAAEECLKCTTLDAEYIQQWLRLDETRSAIQQHHRDMLELEYDHTELEDWSLSLSNDDGRNEKKTDATTPGQISLSTTLPSIQENNALELEEDSNECLWNNSSYMMDREGHELVALLMDTNDCQGEKQWPYAVHDCLNLNNSSDNSWSSNGSDCCHSYEPETYSKRSSAALSGCSDDTGELPAIGTDFTRDFYRLVKFESTKSLASTSSRSLGGALSESGDRETALQNVLTFIAEQQKYVHSCDGKDPRPCSVGDIAKDFNIDGPPQNTESVTKISKNENYVTLKQLATEYSLNEQNSIKDIPANVNLESYPNISYAEEVCLVTPLDVESENCSNISEHPVDICSSISVEISATDFNNTVLDLKVHDASDNSDNLTISSDLIKSGDTLCSDTQNNMSESITSSTSTPDTVVSKIPRLKQTPSKIPVSPNKSVKNNQNNNNNVHESKLPKSKIQYKSSKISRPIGAQKQKAVQMQNSQPQPVITSERLPQYSSGVISTIIDGPPHRAVSFHERATSKDVIDELNRMIQKGDDVVINQEKSDDNHSTTLDEACRPTGWIHVEKDIDLTDPKARANLLDVMMASVSSDSSPTSSCGGSVGSDSTEEAPDYGHLHRLHKFHRQKKVNAARPELAVVRASVPISRPSIIGRPDFFIRYGEKEKEAVASFDFLDELSTTSSSLSCSLEENEDKLTETNMKETINRSDCVIEISCDLQS
ncbi:uncharacterized protein LOC116177237 isoform X3 [Photinus pyralis]|uniref:uncharacterized protein LOC116177237 isoform X3 n=1 Tax=Photinus pyralis TaxID=7054 RepID=UPI00126710DC|nr:uncharacterized protein LOC116177237 isoform X3 [Photinus pyralis]